jgi:hypothetical protein
MTVNIQCGAVSSYQGCNHDVRALMIAMALQMVREMRYFEHSVIRTYLNSSSSDTRQYYDRTHKEYSSLSFLNASKQRWHYC